MAANRLPGPVWKTRSRTNSAAALVALAAAVVFAPAAATIGRQNSLNTASPKTPRGDANRPDHNHPAFAEQTQQRNRMVDSYITGRGVDDPNVIEAMRTVPRHAFVPPRHKRRAYYDHPIPIGLNQTISAPYIVAYMTGALALDANCRVLEIGTGSGYQAAVCAEISREVYSVEILRPLAESAAARLKELGYRNVTVRQGDGYFGWPEKGPFDAIIITAAAPMVPPPLKRQLKPGGRMILPLGSPYGVQTLVLLTKDHKGQFRSKRLLPVVFVPMTGQVQQVEPAKR